MPTITLPYSKTIVRLEYIGTWPRYSLVSGKHAAKEFAADLVVGGVYRVTGSEGATTYIQATEDGVRSVEEGEVAELARVVEKKKSE